MLKQKGPVAVICLLLAVLLLGCAAEPKTRPTPAGTLPGLETGTAESWAPAQSQSFPNTDYTLPDLTEQTETSIGNEPTAAPWTYDTTAATEACVYVILRSIYNSIPSCLQRSTHSANVRICVPANS